MKVYFRPLTCSMSARIVAIEAGLDIVFEEVGERAQTPEQLAKFQSLSFDAHVPVLSISSNEHLIEGPAILQYLAACAPASGLMPERNTFECALVQQWLNYTSSELHKTVFTPMMASNSPKEVRDHARKALQSRFDYLDGALQRNKFLVSTFTIADAYLYPILNWCDVARVNIADWPAIASYRDRLRQRPSIAQALALEAPLYFQGHKPS